MKTKKRNCKEKSQFVDEIGITSDTLTSRGGLVLFARYFRNSGILPQIDKLFGGIRKSAKGQSVVEIFKQILCNFVDGTSRHLIHYDRVKEDEGYAQAIESSPQTLLSSHTVKRFFKAFFWPRIWLFRRLLHSLFIWRLKLEKPEVIVLALDSMVMDNDEAEEREGVQPTYKNVEGFQPLQMTWDRYVIDAVFRGGSKHTNHGDTVEKMVRHVVSKIRKDYSRDIPIVINTDSGLFDQKLFKVYEDLEIGYICSGKLYDDIKAFIKEVDCSLWGQYQNKEQVWDYVEFMDKRGSWDRSRRAIFCRPLYEGVQQLLDFARPDTILYTNLGMGQKIDEFLCEAGHEELLKAEKVIECAHSRGRDELIHRALKDFGHEELPFKRFAPNAAYYYTMLLAFFLYETFKKDVCSEVLPVVSYATTFRRRIIDIAAKIVRTSGKTILKVTSTTWKQLTLDVLWAKSGDPPQCVWA
jgi:hypothetical protein